MELGRVLGFLATAVLPQRVIWLGRDWSPSKPEPFALCVASATDGDTFQLCGGGRVRLGAVTKVMLSGGAELTSRTFVQ